MSSQYGSIRPQYTSEDWDVVSEPGGNLTSGGTIALRIQGHNRVGLNLISQKKEITYSAGQKIVVTLNPSIRASGEELFKIVVSGSNLGCLPGEAVQLAEWNARADNQVDVIPLPATLELTEDSHLDLGQQVSGADSFPLNPILGMVRQVPNGDVFRWIGAEWVVELKGRFTNVSSTKGAKGADQPTSTAVVLIGTPPKTDLDPTSTALRLWWAHGASLDKGAVLSPGFLLSLEILIDGKAFSPNGIPFSTIFDGLIFTKFQGVVNRFTGQIEVAGDGVAKRWRPLGGTMKLAQEVMGGRALAYDIILEFNNAVLAPYLNSGGSVITINLAREELVGIPVPVGPITGDVVTNRGDRLRIVPNKRLGGAGIFSGGGDIYYEIPYSDIEYPILDLLADTTEQKIVLNPAAGAVPVAKCDVFPPEFIRAIVSTEPGTQTVSPFVDIQTGSSAGIELTISFPSNDEGVGTIRGDYPDEIIRNIAKADFNVPSLYVYLDARMLVSDGGDSWFRFGPYSVIPAAEQKITILSEAEGMEIQESDLPVSVPEFGPFGYGTLSLEPVPSLGTMNLQVGSRVGIAYHYPSPNFSLTKIRHSGFPGSVEELDSTVSEAVNGLRGWRGYVSNIEGLRSLGADKLNNGDVRLVLQNQRLFYYNSTSELADDGNKIIQPTAISTTGRWLAISSEVPLTQKGQILTYDGESVTPLAGGTDNYVLIADSSSPTGLRWGESPGSGGGGGGGAGSSIPLQTDNGAIVVAKPPYRERLEINPATGDFYVPETSFDRGSLSYEVIGRASYTDDYASVPLVYHREVRGSLDPSEVQEDFDFPRYSLVATTWGRDPDSRYDGPGESSFFKVVKHPKASGRVLVSQDVVRFDTPPYAFTSFTLNNLNDTYLAGTIPAEDDVLTWSITQNRWVPKGSTSAFSNLTSLKDVQLPPSLQDGNALVYNGLTNKWSAGVPDLSAVQGLETTTTVETVVGDSSWGNVVLMITARAPLSDARGNYALRASSETASAGFPTFWVPSDADSVQLSDILIDLFKTTNPFPQGPYGGRFTGRVVHSFGIKFASDQRNALTFKPFCWEGWFFPSTKFAASSGLPFAGRTPIFKRKENSDMIVEYEWRKADPSSPTFQPGDPLVFSCKVKVTFFGATELILLSNEIDLDLWFHLAIVRDGNTFSLYINGARQATASAAITLRDPSATPNNPAYFGNLYEVGVDDATNYNGGYSYVVSCPYIEDFRWTIGRSRYTGNFTPPDSPLPIGQSFQTSSRAYQIKLAGATDFDSSVTPQDGWGVVYNSSANKYRPAPIGSTGGAVLLALNDLTNVNTNPSVNDSIKWNGSTWISYDPRDAADPITINGITSSTFNLTTDNIPETSNKQYFSPQAVANAIANGVLLSDLSDVAANITPTPTSVLGFRDGEWKPVDLVATEIGETTERLWFTVERLATALAATSITTLLDVSVTAASTPGQVLIWNGSAYSPTTLTGGYSPPVTLKGDLFTFSDEATRLSVGVDGQMLIADSASPTGLNWVDQPVVVPYSPPVTTKGDIFTSIGPSQLGGARLPIGSQGQVLTVNTSQPTSLEWKDLPASGGGGGEGGGSVADLLTTLGDLLAYFPADSNPAGPRRLPLPTNIFETLVLSVSPGRDLEWQSIADFGELQSLASTRDSHPLFDAIDGDTIAYDASQQLWFPVPRNQTIPAVSVVDFEYGLQPEDNGKILMVRAASTIYMDSFEINPGFQVRIFRATSEVVGISSGENNYLRGGARAIPDEGGSYLMIKIAESEIIAIYSAP